VHVAKLWTCIIDNKKRASKGLKKIIHAIEICAQAIKNESKEE
jgi:hypothetical protein